MGTLNCDHKKRLTALTVITLSDFYSITETTKFEFLNFQTNAIPNKHCQQENRSQVVKSEKRKFNCLLDLMCVCVCVCVCVNPNVCVHKTE